MFSLFANYMKFWDINALCLRDVISFGIPLHSAIMNTFYAMNPAGWNGVMYSLNSGKGEHIVHINDLLFQPIIENSGDKSGRKSIFYIPNHPPAVYCLSRRKFPSAFIGARNASDL